MKLNWIARVLMVSIILVQGFLGRPPVSVIPLGEPVLIPEASAVRVGKEGLCIDVLAVGYMWYVDGASDIFAEVVATHRGERGKNNLRLHEPFIFQNIRIEMLAGDFASDCTLTATRIELLL